MKTKNLFKTILTGCSAFLIGSAMQAQCTAGFTYSTDVNNCITHFTNTSSGTNLTYKWIVNSTIQPYTSSTYTATNPDLALSLGNGTTMNWNVQLFTYSSGVVCDSTQQTVSVTCGTSQTTTPCQAAYSYSTDINCVTHFFNASTGTNLSYRWDFGISADTAASPSVGFPYGSYPVTLYSYSNGIICDSLTQNVNITCNGANTITCQAGFTVSTDANCMTNFTNISTGSNLTYDWLIVGNTTFSFSASHASMYNTLHLSLSMPNGNYNAYLKTYSDGVACDSAFKNVTVNCNNTSICQVTSSISIFADNTNPGNYFCYNQSTGNGTLTYLWDFGDGTTSTQQYPFHQYAQPGNYPVCLTTTNNNGTLTCSATDCDSSSVQRMASGFVMSSINVIPQSVTGIKNVGENLSFKAFPNPIADVLNIEFTNENVSGFVITITDAMGREVLSKEVSGRTSTLNTSYLSKGFYNLILLNDKGEVLKINKLVK